MSGTSSPNLFSPIQLGSLFLKHRVIMAPLTRSRSIQPDSVPGDLMREYYERRASDGGLIISEATNISLTSRGWLGAPGLYSDQQVEGWKEVVAAVMPGAATCLSGDPGTDPGPRRRPTDGSHLCTD